RSFARGNSGHGGGTHYVMTGTDHPAADAGASPIRPSFGAIVSRVRGANHPASGIPTYVGISGLYADGPNWLGAGYAPFQIGGQAAQHSDPRRRPPPARRPPRAAPQRRPARPPRRPQRPA